MKLALGVKAGARVLNVDWSKGRYYDGTDVLLNTNIDNKITPSVGAGAYLYSDKWYVGASVPSFIRGDYYDDVQQSVNIERLHYYVMAGYVFDFSDIFKFKPAFLARGVNGAPISVDVSANFLIQEKFTLGAGYRWDDSVSALAGFQISRDLFIGYSYDMETTKLANYNSGSHEIFLRFELFNNIENIVSPRFF